MTELQYQALKLLASKSEKVRNKLYAKFNSSVFKRLMELGLVTYQFHLPGGTRHKLTSAGSRLVGRPPKDSEFNLYHQLYSVRNEVHCHGDRTDAGLAVIKGSANVRAYLYSELRKYKFRMGDVDFHKVLGDIRMLSLKKGVYTLSMHEKDWSNRKYFEISPTKNIVPSKVDVTLWEAIERASSSRKTGNSGDSDSSDLNDGVWTGW